MILNLKYALIVLTLFVAHEAKAQDVAIHNNLYTDVMGDLSLGVELATKPRTTIEVYGSIRPWNGSASSVHKHWLVQGQYRFWTCQKYNGIYWGPFAHFGEYNISDTTLPLGFLKGLKDSRYEGWLAGTGIGGGYEYAISKHWNIGGEIGLGYTFIKYKKFDCGECGSLTDKGNYHYFGLSKLGVNIIYLF